MDWKIIVQIIVTPIITLMLLPLLKYIFQDKLTQIKESNDAVKKSVEEMKTSTSKEINDLKSSTKEDIKGVKDSVATLDSRVSKDMLDLRSTNSHENAEIRTSINVANGSVKETNDKILALDRSVLEYKSSITGKFAELSEKYVSKGDYTREQVQVDSRMRSLDNRIAHFSTGAAKRPPSDHHDD